MGADLNLDAAIEEAARCMWEEVYDQPDAWVSDNYWRGIYSALTQHVTPPSSESILDNIRTYWQSHLADEAFAPLQPPHQVVAHPDTRNRIETVHGPIDVVYSPNLPEGTIVAVNRGLLEELGEVRPFTLDNAYGRFQPVRPFQSFYRPSAYWPGDTAGIDTALRQLQASIARAFRIPLRLIEGDPVKRARMRYLHTSYRQRTRRRAHR